MEYGAAHFSKNKQRAGDLCGGAQFRPSLSTIFKMENSKFRIQRLNNHLQVLLNLKKEQDSQLARLCLGNETVSDKEKSFYEWKIKEFEIQLEHVRNCKGECRTKKAIVATQVK
jgi:hypothetical protein